MCWCELEPGLVLCGQRLFEGVRDAQHSAVVQSLADNLQADRETGRRPADRGHRYGTQLAEAPRNRPTQADNGQFSQ